MQDRRVTHNRLLEITALAGEFPHSLMSRLYGRNYKEKKASELRTKKLAKTYHRDGLRALRLTSRGRKYLLANYPGRFMGTITESNHLKPDIPHRLRYHMLSGSYVSMDNAGGRIFQDERPPLREITAGGRENYPFPAFYESREVKGQDNEGAKIKGARFTGVLFTRHNIYICYNTGAAPLKWEPRAEQRTFALVNALGRELFPGQYRESNVRAIMLGDHMDVAYSLLTESQRGKWGRRAVFYLDGVYDHFYYAPADTNGDFLLEVLCDEDLYGRIARQICQGFEPPDDELNLINDGFDEDGNPVLFAFEFDMKRILGFIEGVQLFGCEKAIIIICFDFQASTLFRICDQRFDIRSIGVEQSQRMFGQGGAE